MVCVLERVDGTAARVVLLPLVGSGFGHVVVGGGTGAGCTVLLPLVGRVVVMLLLLLLLLWLLLLLLLLLGWDHLAAAGGFWFWSRCCWWDWCVVCRLVATVVGDGTAGPALNPPILTRGVTGGCVEASAL